MKPKLLYFSFKKHAALCSQEQIKVGMKVRRIKSEKRKKEVLSWRCLTCPRLRKSTRRLHRAAQRSWTWLWTHHRFVQNVEALSPYFNLNIGLTQTDMH